MAIFNKASWHGTVPNRTPNGMGTIRGLVLHIMDSLDNGTLPPHQSVDTIDGCNTWFHDSASQVSAHFGTGTQGELYQWVDTSDAAWAIVAGNDAWISIENSGVSGDSLLPTQLNSCAEVLAWLHTTHGVPLVVTNSPSVDGLGWHGMGGLSWGGHFQCPGQPILDQRPAIIAAAKALLGPSPSPHKKEDPMYLIEVSDPAHAPSGFPQVAWVTLSGGKVSPVAAADLSTIAGVAGVTQIRKLSWASLAHYA